jgi:hypothetical protein
MKNKCFMLFSAALYIAVSGAASAKDISAEQIPRAVMDKFSKMYPDAKDIAAETITHFNMPLIKIAFKKGDEPEIEYYRPAGTFFVNGFDVNEDEIPLEVQQSLKKEFPDYRLKAASLIVNPNGPGREYEVDIATAGSDWEIVADENGEIISKTQD